MSELVSEGRTGPSYREASLHIKVDGTVSERCINEKVLNFDVVFADRK